MERFDAVVRDHLDETGARNLRALMDDRERQDES
jgi:hypothetical protein